jgi:hypothetical protein
MLDSRKVKFRGDESELWPPLLLDEFTGTTIPFCFHCQIHDRRVTGSGKAWRHKILVYKAYIHIA